jgi:hypothetical protein
VAKQRSLVLPVNTVGQGKPLALLHAALGAYPEWKTYKRWAGHVWKWGSSSHPYEAAILQSTTDDPLALAWTEAWLPADEVYIDLEETAPVNDSLIATISKGQYPAAWTSAAYSEYCCLNARTPKRCLACFCFAGGTKSIVT